MNKYEVFVNELKYIKNNKYRDSLKKLLELLPNYFYEIAASSTGKYHPKYSLGKGGLVRHTKVAVRIANDLLSTKTFGNDFNEREKDLLLYALIVHDGLKEGLVKQPYTIFDHPLVIAQFISDNASKIDLDEEDVKFLVDVVSSHMGEWNTCGYSTAVLPLPETKYQKFVHMCDYLSSRKFLNVNFTDNEIVE